MELESERLQLRELCDADLATTQRYAADPEVVRYMAWGPNTPEETREFLARAQRAARLEPRTDFELAIVVKQGGRHVGACGLMGRRLRYREYEIGYCLAREVWGRGFGSEAVRALLEFAFGELGAHRIYACIDPRNLASRALAERVGFRSEGRLRCDTQIRGEWRDSLILALLDDEYPLGRS